VLGAAGVEDSIILDGARVHRVSGVHGSVVGRDATVSAEARTAGSRLVVGDHSSVVVAA
jgi:glucose-1-phosphate thymidylyltransferase